MSYSCRACIGFYSLCVNKVHYNIQNSLSPTPILSQINPVHSHSSYLFKIYFKITLPSTPRSAKFPSGSPTKTPLHATCPNPLISFDLFILLVFGEQYKSQCSSFKSFLQSPITSSLSGPHIFSAPTLRHPQCCSSHNVRGQVSHI